MPTKIKPDFKPSERTYTNLLKHGVSMEFINYELENFVNYWLERGENGDKLAKKSAWQTACMNWMRRGFQGSAGKRWEEMRDRTVSRRSEPKQGNIFANVLDNMEKSGAFKKENIAKHSNLVITLPERPEIEIDESKTSADYLNELGDLARKLGA